jgi:beta-phosphoglucomutase-like phosphatase (HAD superfamily)
VQQLTVDAQQAVAIEDSSNGLRSAARAGLRVIAVPTKPFPPDKDALGLASVVVHSLDDRTASLVTSLAERG